MAIGDRGDVVAPTYRLTSLGIWFGTSRAGGKVDRKRAAEAGCAAEIKEKGFISNGNLVVTTCIQKLVAFS